MIPITDWNDFADITDAFIRFSVPDPSNRHYLMCKYTSYDADNQVIDTVLDCMDHINIDPDIWEDLD